MRAAPHAHAPAGSGATLTGRGRNRGVDVARAVAIIGMGAVHFSFAGAAAADGQAAALPEGPRNVAILFVLVAGLGVSLLDRARSASRPRTRRRLLWRTLVFLPLGLGLQELDHGLAVILQDFALLFAVGAVAIALSDRALAWVTAAAFLIGPALHVTGETLLSGVVFGDPPGLTDPPLAIARDLLLTGTYPLVTHVAPFLLGLWIGRRDVAAPLVQARLLAAGAVLGLGLVWGGLVLGALLPPDAPRWLALAIADEPLSQSFLWLWQVTAASVAALGACLVIGDAAPRLVTPLVALGQLAMTVYVGHLLVIAVDQETLRSDDVLGVGLRVLAFVVVSAGFATAWRRRFRRGPVEWVLDAPLVAWERRRTPTG
jgi:hypothetical protein